MPKTDIPFESLVADLHGPDWQKRCDAARLLGQSRDPRAVDALLPDLEDPDWRVRRNAVQALGALKTPRAVKPLLQALNDRTNTVRQRAAVGLGRIKDPEAIPILIRVVLENDNSQVSEAAYHALKKFGRKAGPFLLQALQSRVHVYLIDLLAESKVPGGAERLIELAGHQDLQIRLSAVAGLGKTGDPRAAVFLSQAMRAEEAGMRVTAIQALGHLNATGAIPGMLDLLQDHDLHGPHSGTYHAISEALQEMSGIKSEVANAFPGRYPTLSMGGSTSDLPEMFSMLGDQGFGQLNDMLANMESRMAGLGATMNLPPEIVQQLSDQTWRFGAMFADARDAKGERVKLLIGLLDSESPLKRLAAALALPWYIDEGALEPLEKAAQDSDEVVSRAAGWAYEALKTALGHKRDMDGLGFRGF